MLKRLAILGLFGTLATVSLLKGQTAPLSTPKQGIAKPGSSQNGSAQPNPQDSKQAAPNAMTSSQQPTTPTCDEGCQQGRQNLAIQGKLEWFTGVLAIVGVLQVGTMIWQAWLLKGTLSAIQVQAKDARTSTKVTLDAIRDQTTQLERQVQASHDGLRAWVGIDIRENQSPMVFAASMIDQINNLLVPTPPQFVWEMKNYGQTPAFIQKMGSTHTYAEVPSLYPMPMPIMLPIIAFIGTGREKVNPLTIKPEDLCEVEAKTKFWRIVIKLEYLDVFDKTKVHETMVSFHYYVPKSEKDPLKRGFYQEIDRTMNYNT